MILLNHIGKKFQHNWIFKGIQYTFEDTGIYAILGHNGSGKSTLMRIIAGMQNPTVGKCQYRIKGKEISAEKIYQQLSYCAPGMQLIEEMTLKEFLKFHFSFKSAFPEITPEKIIDMLHFRGVEHKFLYEFSSGMKQRVKLAQAFFVNSPILLLDEPCSNLDEPGIQLYANLLEQYAADRLVLIASNDPREYPGATQYLKIENFRPAPV